MTASLETSTVEGRGWATHCPWLWQLQGSERLAVPHGRACALRPGLRRAPSADELAWFCTNARAHACPSYRRHVAAGADPCAESPRRCSSTGSSLVPAISPAVI